METLLRIRESSPSEMLADRLEREAQLATNDNPVLAQEYRRQAEMLRDMIAIQKTPARNMFADNFHTNA